MFIDQPGNISDVDVTGLDSSRPEDELRAEIAGLSRAASEVKDAEETEVKVKNKQVLGLELDDDMELDKQFDLPLDQVGTPFLYQHHGSVLTELLFNVQNFRCKKIMSLS